MNQWVKVKQQGPYEHLFPEEVNYYDPNPVQKIHQRISSEVPPPGERESNKTFFCSQDQAEDISRLHREGYDIGNYYNFLSRIILAIGGRIHMPHRIIEVGVEFIIGHMQM